MEGKQGICSLKWPIQRGVITDWDNMEKIWRWVTGDEMRLVVQGQDSDIEGLFITEPCMNSRKNRQKTAQFWFEEQDIQKFYVGLQSVLAIYGNGRSTGVCVSVGDGVTEVVPLFDSYPMRHAFQRIHWGGADCTQWLSRELHKANAALETTADALILQKIKEEMCHVALDYNGESAQLTEKGQKFNMPDGSPLTLNTQIISCPEILFDPMMAGKDVPGVAQLTNNAIKACPMDIRAELYNSILCNGGSSMFGQFPERLRYDLGQILHEEIELKVIAPTERNILTWLGAKIISNLSVMRNESMFVSKAEYDEKGAMCVHKMSPS
jgi:actin-related protein